MTKEEIKSKLMAAIEPIFDEIAAEIDRDTILKGAIDITEQQEAEIKALRASTKALRFSSAQADDAKPS